MGHKNKYNLPWKRETLTSHISQAPIVVDCEGRVVVDICKPSMEEAVDFADFICTSVNAAKREKTYDAY